MDRLYDPVPLPAALARTALGLDNAYRNRQLASGGMSTVDRGAFIGSTTFTSGHALFSGFTAIESESIGNLRYFSAGGGSSGLTVGKLGLYSVDAAGNLTRLATTTNDTTLNASTWATYTRAIASTPIVAGSRYAVGLLLVGTTPGSVAVTGQNWASATGFGMLPWVAGWVAGQTDLAANYAVGALNFGSTNGSPAMMVLP